MTDLGLHPDFTPAPAILFATIDAAELTREATHIAQHLSKVIRDQRLAKRIGQSEYVFFDGWTTAGAMLKVFPIVVHTAPLYEGDTLIGFEATAEARTISGQLVGRADAECTVYDGEKWERALREGGRFQLRSMAQTRAGGKALRMPLGFVIKLAGFEPTPAEELDEQAAARGETVTGGKGVAFGWRDQLEQDREHRRLDEFVTGHGLAEQLAAYLTSKGYDRPLAKGQFRQVEKAMVRELQERGQQASDPGQAVGPPAAQPGSDLTSGADMEAGTPSTTPAGQSAPDSSTPEPNPAAAEPAGSGAPHPDSVSLGPGGSGGGAKGARPARSVRGRQTRREESHGAAAGTQTDEAEQAAFEQAQADDDPGRWSR